MRKCRSAWPTIVMWSVGYVTDVPVANDLISSISRFRISTTLVIVAVDFGSDPKSVMIRVATRDCGVVDCDPTESTPGKCFKPMQGCIHLKKQTIIEYIRSNGKNLCLKILPPPELATEIRHAHRSIDLWYQSGVFIWRRLVLSFVHWRTRGTCLNQQL